MPDVFVGRQPIYDRGLNVHGYELLFRQAGDSSSAGVSDGDRATSQVVLDTFLELGTEEVVGNRHAFLNLTRGFLVGDLPLPIAPDRVVLEVLEDIEFDGEVMEGMRELSAQGFRLALDDFEYEPGLEHVLELADIVKVDCLALGPERVRRDVEALRRFDLVLLAEKIETQEEFDLYKAMGFDLFQGYFLARPANVSGKRAPKNRLALLRLVARLQDPAVQFEELEELITQDVSLSYQLVRHVNSVLYSLQRQIEAVRDAIVVLGMDKVRDIASLILFLGIDDRPADLVTTAMVRARMCEGLLRAQGSANAQAGFTTGLFSVLDALLEHPLQELLEGLPLDEQIVEALLSEDGGGELGGALRCTLAYERCEWSEVRLEGLSPTDIRAANLGAIDFASQAEDGLRRAA